MKSKLNHFIRSNATGGTTAITLTGGSTIAIIGITGTSNATLPSAVTAGAGRVYLMHDETGLLNSTGNITFSAAVGNINGSSTFTFSTAYGFTRIESNGANWFMH